MRKGIKIIKQTEPGMCGGTDATLDTNAPKEIKSADMTIFKATSNMSCIVGGDVLENEGPIGYVSAYAARSGRGTFLYLETTDGNMRYEKKNCKWAYVKADIMPELVKMVNECGLAKSNGYHSETHGLPENFGGNVDIRYASGEKISFSDNQCPIFSIKTAQMIRKVFNEAMAGEKVELPDVKDLRKINYLEERKSGYTKATLTFREDGTIENDREAKYDDKVYNTKKELGTEVAELIKNNIVNCGMLAWGGLPESGYSSGRDCYLTFVFEDGTEIKIDDKRDLNYGISSAFFNISLEITK